MPDKRISELPAITTLLNSDLLTFVKNSDGDNKRIIYQNAIDVANVKAFGAIGDGITDDTDAIQAAIDSIDFDGGGTVFFPTGIYLISDTLTMDQGIYLRGVSPKSTIISSNVAAAGWAITITRSHRGFYDLPDMGGIEDIQVIVNTAGANGIRVIDGWWFSFRELIVMGGTWAGTRAAVGISMEYGSEGSAYCYFSNVQIIYCVVGLVIDGSPADFANRYHFSGVRIVGILAESTYGIRMIQASTHTGSIMTESVITSVYMNASDRNILDVILEGTETTSLEMVNDCRSNKLIGNFDSAKLTLTSETNTMLFTDRSFRFPNEVGLYDVTPVTQAGKILDPAGGGVIDAQARTAINEIIDVLERIGITDT